MLQKLEYATKLQHIEMTAIFQESIDKAKFTQHSMFTVTRRWGSPSQLSPIVISLTFLKIQD